MPDLSHQALTWLMSLPRGWSIHCGDRQTTVYVDMERIHRDANPEDAIIGAWEEFCVKPALKDVRDGERDELNDYTQAED